MRKVIGRIVRKVCSFLPCRIKYVPVYIPVLRTELLKGRKALITGGGSGIGYAIAEACLKAGAEVVITGRDAGKLDASVSRLCAFGRISALRFDLLVIDEYEKAIEKIGKFDILVNNAGYVGGGSFGNTSVSEYDKVLETNLKGAYFLAQFVSRCWIKDKIQGNILNVCSASSLRPGNSPYILSKWGLRALTVGMARDLIRYGIVVNGIAPGCANTPHFCSVERDDITNPGNPSGRFVTLEEVANLSVMLVSNLARMVVGDILYVTGGAAITTFDD